MKNLGIILLIAVGMAIMVITGFNYVTSKDVRANTRAEINKEEGSVKWSPIIGGAIVIGGLLMLMTDKKRVI
jgi:hypothetical protein